jgi:hypothetical protein
MAKLAKVSKGMVGTRDEVVTRVEEEAQSSAKTEVQSSKDVASDLQSNYRSN